MKRNFNSSRVKSQTPEWRMHQRAKQRCKKSGMEFTITVDDIQIPDRCPILGIKLNMNSGRSGLVMGADKVNSEIITLQFTDGTDTVEIYSGAFPNSPSLDRIDNTKGYTPDNIWVISQRANAMKSAASDEELVRFAEWFLENRSGSNDTE